MNIKDYFDLITEAQIAEVMSSLEPDIVLGFKDGKPNIYCVDGWENEKNCFVCDTTQFFELFRLSGSTNKYILEYV